MPLSLILRAIASFSTCFASLFRIVLKVSRGALVLFARVLRTALLGSFRLIGRTLMRLLTALSSGLACLFLISGKIARSPALAPAFIRHDLLLKRVLDC